MRHLHIHSQAWNGLKTRRGFSLIEVIIVAVILSILAGIGMISVTYIMENARKKATIAEARQISTAIEFSHQETGFFPKFNYIVERLKGFTGSTGEGIVDNAGNVYKGMDYIGVLSGNVADPVYMTYNRRLQDNWNGPYWSQSPTNKSTAEGPAGMVEMQIPDRNNEVRRWPADQWGHPYVLYLMEQYEDTTANPATIKVRFLQNPLGEPNFACAVVSYGADGMPGKQMAAGEAGRKISQLLYTELFPKRLYRMLSQADYNDVRMFGYSEKRFKTYGGYTNPLGYDLVGCTDYIADPAGTGYITSDDVVIEF
ncbi:MAG: prepilin-type N-terminal cleavage/methylation domain-containing protein [Candidatus Sumerlaeota bacterium]|nr:prepilin-type N-terminal cleavage/methylation domain-containing protein [Candidatus Sumerlaeota bacterium]